MSSTYFCKIYIISLNKLQNIFEILWSLTRIMWILNYPVIIPNLNESDVNLHAHTYGNSEWFLRMIQNNNFVVCECEVFINFFIFLTNLLKELAKMYDSELQYLCFVFVFASIMVHCLFNSLHLIQTAVSQFW